MPLYFFHLSFGDRTVPDDEGVELPNRSAARAEALARSAMLIQQLLAVRKRTEQLLQHNQRLRDELSSLCLASEGMRVRTSRLVLVARLAGSPADDLQASRAATKPPRPPPYLVLLPGRDGRQ
jgi:hypothetical protein